jgi:hypothetical protein
VPRHPLPTLIGLLSVGALLAGCGSSSPKPASDVQTPASGNQSASMIPFADCMRANGVPNFPDPTSDRIQIQSTNDNTEVNGVSVKGPAFQKAMQACHSKMPRPLHKGPPVSQAKAQAAALKYAACMRSHGVPNFPDPKVSTSNGGVQVQIGAGSGVDPNTPAFKAAQADCQSVMHEVLPIALGAPGP